MAASVLFLCDPSSLWKDWERRQWEEGKRRREGERDDNGGRRVRRREKEEEEWEGRRT